MRYSLFAIALILSGCSFGVPVGSTQTPQSTQAGSTPNTSRYKKPKKYIVFGKQYTVLDSSEGYVKRGIASWYGKKFHGRKTANGEVYNMYEMTAAHKTLPMPTMLSVKNLSTGKTIIVRVNDRGPFVGERIVDLSYAAAKALEIDIKGTQLVEIRALGKNNNPSIRTIPLKTADDAPTVFIQTGYFAVKKNALAQLKQLKQAGFDHAKSYVSKTEKGEFYRVRLGPYSALEKAQKIMQRLSQTTFKQSRLIIEN